MKLFVKKILFAISIFILLLIIFSAATFSIVNKNSSFSLPQSDTILVIGHSHPQTAFNDSLIPGLRNLSQSSESYFYSFQKIKKVLEQNTHIKTIFLEYTNNYLWERMDRWIWDDKRINIMYPRYAPFMSIKENVLLASKNLPGYFKSLSVALKKHFTKIIEQNYKFSEEYGGYWNLKMNKVDSLLNEKQNNSMKEKTGNFSKYNIEYLKKIIALCNKKDVKIYLIRSPLHNQYEGFFNEKLFFTILNNKLPDIEFLDFSKFPLMNEEFGDLGHVNYKGALVFTKWFKSSLNNGLLEASDKQNFINSNFPFSRF